MIELDRIYNEDCLEGMQRIPDGSVDCIICDLPYGTMKGYGSGMETIDSTRHEWDDKIPTDQLFEQYERILRRQGTAILFSQEPYTSHLRTHFCHNFEFCYPLIWKKDVPGIALNSKRAPRGYFEDISVYRKMHDKQGLHPLRDYGRMVVAFIGKNAGAVQNDFRAWNIPTPTRAQHFLSPDAVQYTLCTAETYDLLIKHYGIDKMEGFKSFAELSAISAKYESVFNLPEGRYSMSNVLEFPKDTDGFHPTQKPVALIRRLIATYSNEGDTILDNCMGSGTTAIACIKEHRHFIGFELNEEYYAKSLKRIEEERKQLALCL